MEDKIGVCVRVRPLSSGERNQRQGVAIAEDRSTITINSKPDIKHFSFDYIADEASAQEEIFNNVGLPMAKTCLNGFNGTIICYGQTGTGKSYTIFGGGGSCSLDNTDRGIVPRVFEYLFNEHDKNPKTSLVAKCSFYEIYQEKVFDLLDVASTGSLQVREDSKLGVFVDGIMEEQVTSANAAFDVLSRGYNNRHVGETSMNRESSRSHAVFLLSLEVTEERENGVKIMKKSKFSLVDLAGSERQKDTNATGDRLKEASQINKSLSALGNVINALSTNDTGSRLNIDKQQLKHVHYRDSKLTFLLRDSIGGNSKTVLVATITPAESQMAETLSTLKFAQRAKLIRNVVVCNEESTGTVVSLQKEILALKAKVTFLQGGGVSTNSVMCTAGSSGVAIAEYEEKLRALEKENVTINSKFEQSEKNLLGHKMTLKMRDGEVQRLKKNIEYIKDECDRQTADAFLRIDELTASVDRLSNELRERDEETKNRVGSLEKSSDEVREHFRAKEAEYRESHNKAMKDNTILLKTCRELESSLGLTKSALLAKDSECETLTTDLQLMSEEAASEKVRLHVIIDEKSANIDRFSNAVLDLEQQIKDITEYSRSLEKLNASMKETMDKMASDHSITVAELEESKKHLRTAADEISSLIDGKRQMQATLDEANMVRAELKVEAMRLSDNLGEFKLLLEVSNIERNNLGDQIAALNEQSASLAQSNSTLVSDLESVTKERDNYLSNYKRCAESLAVKQNELIAEEDRGRRLDAEISDMQNKSVQQSDDIRALTEAGSLAKDCIATFETSMAELEDELNESRDELIKMTETSQVTERQLLDLRSELSALVQTHSEAVALSDTLQASVTSLTVACQARDAVVAEKDAIIKEKDNVINVKICDNSKKDVTISEKESVISDLASKVDFYSKLNADKCNEVAEKIKEMDALRSEVHDLRAEADAAQLEIGSLNSQLDETVQAKAKMQRMMDLLKGEADDLHDTALKMQSKILEKEMRIGALVDQISDAADRSARNHAAISSVCHDLTGKLDVASSELERLQLETSRAAENIADLEARLTESTEAASKVREMQKRAREADEQVSEIGKKLLKLEEAVSEKDEQLVEMSDAKKALKKANDKLAKLEGADDKLKAALRDLTKEAQAAASLKVQLSILEDSKKELQVHLQQAQAKSDKAAQQVTDMQAENAKLCGHQNNKQKIQLHMQLKKDIEEQASLIKQQQEQIVQLTLERDAASAAVTADTKAASAAAAIKRKNAAADGHAVSIAFDEDLVAKVAPVKRSRRVLRDTNAAADKENVY